MATAGFSCLYCSKWLRSKIGLGVHTQSQHREQYEAAIQIPKSKTRWSSEELALMAMSEATLIKQGKTSEINTELLSQFPNRTREAIKGQRRQLKYKNLVKEYVQSGLPSATPVVAVPSSSATSVMSDSSLTSNLSMASSSIVSGDLPTNRPVTRRQKRIAEAVAQDSLPPKPNGVTMTLLRCLCSGINHLSVGDDPEEDHILFGACYYLLANCWLLVPPLDSLPDLCPGGEPNAIKPSDAFSWCPDCSRSFSTKIGLGVHSRRQHPQQFHERALVTSRQKKARWTDADCHRLAEARIVSSTCDPVININQILRNLFPSRTLEAIKGKRRAPDYRRLVEEKIELLRSNPSAIPSTTLPPVADASSDHSPRNENVEGNSESVGMYEPEIIALFSAEVSRIPEEIGQRPDELPGDADSDPSLVIENRVPEAADVPESSVEDIWHMTEDTLIQGSLEYNVDDLNSDFRLTPRPSSEEILVLDSALSLIKSDPEKAKSLLTNFLIKALSPSEFGNVNKSKKIKRPRKKIITSKRKAKKIEYARLQALYKRNRSNCFSSLFEKSSLSPDLEDKDVFDFWSHLFTKSSPQNFKNTPPFVLSDSDISDDLFITPQEIYKAKLPFNSSSGPDGASVKT
ncbi:hypothetical protein AVEN_165428-1 [Araneus ventricosus]|uniref:C2H2-type domain-containing protein n=1 Tax=Araneus ventricosus TaxID=182803 RepID=A0A4Y2ATT0_ARAVE|nr:hypothetical protein AVEN_165428-1 [Araneus ventricosus]